MKYVVVEHQPRRLGRSPHGERGLKCEGHVPEYRHLYVAPPRGAWIEIRPSRHSRHSVAGRSPTGSVDWNSVHRGAILQSCKRRRTLACIETGQSWSPKRGKDGGKPLTDYEKCFMLFKIKLNRGVSPFIGIKGIRCKSEANPSLQQGAMCCDVIGPYA